MRRPRARAANEGLKLAAPEPERARSPWQCFRCDRLAPSTKRTLLTSPKSEGGELSVPICSSCAATIFACLERRTRLTPIYSWPDELPKTFCRFCRFRTYADADVCNVCREKELHDD